MPCKYLFLSALLICCYCHNAYCQDSTSLYSKAYNIPDKFFKGIQSKSAALEKKLIRQTDKYLNKLARREQKLRNKLQKTNPSKAKELFSGIDERYSRLSQSLHEQTAKTGDLTNTYSGHVDSVSTMLQFLHQQQGGITRENNAGSITSALNNYQQLQDKLYQAERIKKEIRERQRYLKQQLENTPLAKEFRKFQKDIYYYRAQVDEYRKELSDPRKLEARLLKLANKIPAFQRFFSRHSQFAAMFSVPEGYGAMTALQGLQTRAGIQDMLQQRIAAGGQGAQEMVRQNMAAAQAQLHQLKDKINQLRENGGDTDMPDFKPNNQRTKPFLKRLEFGTNIQSQKAQSYFPVTTDVGLSVGYKLNDKSVVGIGASYKLGLGSGWRDIHLTHQGVGLRSFADWKVKGSFFISGGYERNYRAGFSRISQLRNINAWQQSGLLGISKQYKISKKFSGKVQLLYDFLHAHQVPRAQPVIFRFGYKIQ